MKKRLLELLTTENYSDFNECICVGCVLYKTTTDLFRQPSGEELKLARNLTYKAIDELSILVSEEKIDSTIEPFIVSLAIIENILNKSNIPLKELRQKALLIGYIHSFVQYLWYAQDIKNQIPDMSEERINKIMFSRGNVEMVEPITIGIEANNRGFVVFEPVLASGVVDMKYKFIGKSEGFGAARVH